MRAGACLEDRGTACACDLFFFFPIYNIKIIYVDKFSSVILAESCIDYVSHDNYAYSKLSEISYANKLSYRSY